MSGRRTLPVLTALLVLGSALPPGPPGAPGPTAVPSPWPFGQSALHAQDQLPPISYICPMHGDVVDVAPGKCPTCKMDLEAVRLDLAWSCPNHAAVITGKPGACPVDRRELVQVTVAKYWTCPDGGRTRLLEPGVCGNGRPRTLEQSIREHGDHNPRHGGQFFMAADKWHHLEGTHPRDGFFRMHFYDNFTKVLPANGFSGRLVTREDNGRELETVPLRLGRDGKTMEADLNGLARATKDAPLRLAAKVMFKPGEPEQRFDFTFTELSKEPVPVPVAAPAATAAARVRTSAPSAPAKTTAPATRAATATAAAERAPSTPRGAITSAPPVAASTGTPAAASSSTPTAAAPAMPAPASGGDVPSPLAALADCRPTMSRNDAVAFGQTLPRASRELLRLLALCSAEVETLIKEGQFGLVYQPSILSKDIAIALEDTTAELPRGQRTPASDAIRRVVLAAWMLDLYGDQGNREKLAESYTTFAAAVADIRTAYGATR